MMMMMEFLPLLAILASRREHAVGIHGLHNAVEYHLTNR